MSSKDALWTVGKAWMTEPSPVKGILKPGQGALGLRYDPRHTSGLAPTIAMLTLA